jgi:uncharacterized flavoprotein (TIGR03862 family)
MKSIGIIGGGPAGLRAAEVAIKNGASVTLYDAMRSVGRKFLVAGKSGLNITNNEDLEVFLSRYSGTDLPNDLWKQILTQFDNHALRDWARELGIDTFAASSGKVFPGPDRNGMKAAPLLRRWIKELKSLGVIFKMQHQWAGWENQGELVFNHQGNAVSYQHDAVILALGGASWPQTGSTGQWTNILANAGIQITPLSPANCGWETNWPATLLDEAEGLPMKNLEVRSGASTRRGELVITRYGLEGGPIYRLGPAIRSHESPHVIIDFKPDLSQKELITRMGAVKRNFVREARRRWKLDPATCALLKHLPNRGPWKTVEQLAHEVKNCHIPLTGPRPIEEAISSAGGICWKELDQHLMLKKLPGIYVAGEMIDWEAPTGGYLLQACFATGTHAGQAASSSM